MAKKRPFSAASAVRSALRSLNLEDRSQKIYMTWPALYTVSLQFCRFVSPFVPAESGKPLLEEALHEAIEAYFKFGREDDRNGIERYIATLASKAGDLSRLRLSVRAEEGEGWVIWNYDDPLLDWMSAHGRKAIQIRMRDKPVPKGPILIKLLSYICSVRDLQIAKLDFDLK